MEVLIISFCIFGFVLMNRKELKTKITVWALQRELQGLIRSGMDHDTAMQLLRCRHFFRAVSKEKKPDCWRQIVEIGKKANLSEEQIRKLMKYDGP